MRFAASNPNLSAWLKRLLGFFVGLNLPLCYIKKILIFSKFNLFISSKTNSDLIFYKK